MSISSMTAFARKCSEKDAKLHCQIIDVCDQAAMATWIKMRDDEQAIDLLIANAGRAEGQTRDQQRAVFDVNINGVLNSLDPIIPLMRERGTGQLALISSIAGLRGQPGAPAYAASKAAVLAYGEALRGSLAPKGIGVSVICPGFVRSAITDQNKFTMPFFMEADKAAHIITKAIAKNQGMVIFPWQMRWLSRLMRLLPSPLYLWLMDFLPKKS